MYPSAGNPYFLKSTSMDTENQVNEQEGNESELLDETLVDLVSNGFDHEEAGDAIVHNESFLSQCWSAKLQSNIRSQLTYEHWDPKKNNSIEEHFSDVYERWHHLTAAMSDEEFVHVVISQLPITYQRQFTGGVYRDLTEFRRYLIRADQLERQARSTNTARESDRVRQTSNTRKNHHSKTQRPSQNTQHGERNFRVNTVQWQAGRQARNNNYRGLGSYRHRWNNGGSNRNSYRYNPGYSTRGQSSRSYGNQGGSDYHHRRQDERRNVGMGKEEHRAWTPTEEQQASIR
ncbi:hypothetical protein PR048_000836 [Dryococelus australis]|uniref:Uncharacterized protein n=1 Tax=Dryococelus australis TaxID=614101 RepID=A0ABQ9IFQ3_9NEOP|nr:hypothetical protein PR048_000836 [Dryococelus australis]